MSLVKEFYKLIFHLYVSFCFNHPSFRLDIHLLIWVKESAGNNVVKAYISIHMSLHRWVNLPNIVVTQLRSWKLSTWSYFINLLRCWIGINFVDPKGKKSPTILKLFAYNLKVWIQSHM